MSFMPFQILGIWLRGLLALAIPVLAIFCLKWWYDDSRVVDSRSPCGRKSSGWKLRGRAGPGRRSWRSGPRMAARTAAAARARPGRPIRRRPSPVFRFEPGWNRPTAELAAGAACWPGPSWADGSVGA